jgi:hypothetical protein
MNSSFLQAEASRQTLAARADKLFVAHGGVRTDGADARAGLESERHPRADSHRWLQMQQIAYRARVRALDPLTFFVVVAITAAVSAGVFAHADRHGSRHATAWGVAAFLAAGITVPVYFVRYWTRRKPSS